MATSCREDSRPKYGRKELEYLCGSATTSILLRSCRIFIDTMSLKTKLKVFSLSLSQDIRGRDDSRIALGQTASGRYLKVVYVSDPIPNSVFVITAYELGSKAKRAVRRKR